jgi:hypothetical protein
MSHLPPSFTARAATRGTRPVDSEPPAPSDTETLAERLERERAEAAHLESMRRQGFLGGRPSNSELRERPRR